MLKTTGIPSREQVIQIFPNSERINQKGVAIIECYQEIPCNPCSTSCPHDAIYIPDDINKVPKLNAHVCTGCGICIYNCPGLAITVVAGSYDSSKVIFKIPFELLPLPMVGDRVKGLNRKGEYITDVEVVKVLQAKALDKTNVIQVAVDKKFIHDFITIKVEEKNDEDTIICRCSDISLKRLKELMNDGYTSFEELKRIARIGMGPCQGRTCGQLVARELALFTNTPIRDIKTHTSRPTVMGVKLRNIASGGEIDD